MSTFLKLKLILHWMVSTFLKILKIKKRNENLWLFGAWEGNNYSDNSKYVFEYVNKHMPHINSV